MKVLCLGKLPPPLQERLKTEAKIESVTYVDRAAPLPDPELTAVLSGIDIVLSEPQDNLSENILSRCQALKMVAQRAVGYDNVDLDYCNRSGILLSNTPGVLDNATADLAFSLLLCAARRIVEADRYVRAGLWHGFESDLLLGREISGKTLGIVGLGRIGEAMARRAWGFGLKIIYCRSDHKNSGTTEFELDEKDRRLAQSLGARRVSMEDLLRESDFISLHCPLKKETTNLIGAAELALMKNGCILVNTARGKVVEEKALVEAVTKGNIIAALDVFAQEPTVPPPLLNSPNTVLAPHIGSATDETRFAMAELAVNAVLQVLQGGLPANLVNPQIFESTVNKL